jgi:transposase-like protein
LVAEEHDENQLFRISVPPEIIHQAIWLYVRFALSFRNVEDLLAERGIAISYETVRRWVNHFGPIIAAELRKRRPKPHAVWHLCGAPSTPRARFWMFWSNLSATSMPR